MPLLCCSVGENPSPHVQLDFNNIVTLDEIKTMFHPTDYKNITRLDEPYRGQGMVKVFFSSIEAARTALCNRPDWEVTENLWSEIQNFQLQSLNEQMFILTNQVQALSGELASRSPEAPATAVNPAEPAASPHSILAESLNITVQSKAQDIQDARLYLNRRQRLELQELKVQHRQQRSELEKLITKLKGRIGSSGSVSRSSSLSSSSMFRRRNVQRSKSSAAINSTALPAKAHAAPPADQGQSPPTTPAASSSTIVIGSGRSSCSSGSSAAGHDPGESCVCHHAQQHIEVVVPTGPTRTAPTSPITPPASTQRKRAIPVSATSTGVDNPDCPPTPCPKRRRLVQIVHEADQTKPGNEYEHEQDWGKNQEQRHRHELKQRLEHKPEHVQQEEQESEGSVGDTIVLDHFMANATDKSGDKGDNAFPSPVSSLTMNESRHLSESSIADVKGGQHDQSPAPVAAAEDAAGKFNIVDFLAVDGDVFDVCIDAGNLDKSANDRGGCEMRAVQEQPAMEGDRDWVEIEAEEVADSRTVAVEIERQKKTGKTKRRRKHRKRHKREGTETCPSVEVVESLVEKEAKDGSRFSGGERFTPPTMALFTL